MRSLITVTTLTLAAGTALATPAFATRPADGGWCTFSRGTSNCVTVTEGEEFTRVIPSGNVPPGCVVTIQSIALFFAYSSHRGAPHSQGKDVEPWAADQADYTDVPGATAVFSPECMFTPIP